VTVTEDIQAALRADVSLAALVSTRIFAPQLLQDVTRPYVVHFPVSVTPTQLYAGISSEVRYGYQVSVFADSFASGETVLAAVLACLKRKISTTINVFWQPGSIYLGREAETGIHHFVCDFTVFKLA
jgi:hypothetical protein